MKNQSRLILLAIGFSILAYYTFFYFQAKKSIPFATKVECKIIDKRCSASPSIKNYIKVLFKNKSYQIEINEEDCNNYIVGSKILLNYSKEKDYFFHKDNLSNSRNKIVILICFIVILIIPWKKTKKG